MKIQSKFASRKNKFLREWVDRTIRLLIKLLEQNVGNHNATMQKGGGSFIINRDLLKPLWEMFFFSSFNPFSLELFFRSKKSRLHSFSQDPSSVTSQIRRRWSSKGMSLMSCFLSFIVESSWVSLGTGVQKDCATRQKLVPIDQVAFVPYFSTTCRS